MKKFTSFVLIAMMIMSLVSVAAFTVSADEVELTIGKYGTGMENWPGSPNKGDAEAATQILICPKDAEGNFIPALYVQGIEWTVTLAGDDGSTKTVTLPCATVYNGGTWGIVRLEPCLATGANQFVPVVGVNYTITATAEVDGTTYTGTSAEGDFSIDVEPIVPAPSTVELTIGKYGTGMENWPGSPNKGDAEAATQILICPKDAEGNFIPALYVEGIEWTLTIAGNDGSTKTVTLPCATVYNGGTWGIVRLEPCLATGDNQFVPTAGVTYTITATAEVDGVVYSGTSAADDFSIDVDPIVPGGAAEPTPTPDAPTAEPTPTPDAPTAEPTPDAPATGDATVFAIVLATVALMGMAVVVTKKVRA